MEDMLGKVNSAISTQKKAEAIQDNTFTKAIKSNKNQMDDFKK